MNPETSETIIKIQSVIIFVMFIGSLIISIIYFADLNNRKEELEQSKAYILGDGNLSKLLKSELVDLGKDKVCRDYAEYYNKTLTEKYPYLDIRRPRYVDTCNNQTLCNTTHTFLIVSGFRQVCILDQQNVLCERLE